MKLREPLFICVLLSLLFAPVAASAAGPGLITHIKDHVDPSYEAEGGRLGTFIVKPSLHLMRSYDDNIYSQPTGEKSDHVTAVEPSLSLSSDWDLHRIEAGVEGKKGLYARHNSENYGDYTFFLSGRFDVDYGTYLNVSLRQEHKHEKRSSLEDAGGDRPLEYDVAGASAGFIRELGLLKLYISGAYQEYRYEQMQSSGLTVDNSARNNERRTVQARLAYGSTNESEAYFQGRYMDKHYDFASLSYQDVTYYEARLGFKRDLTGKLLGDIYASYAFQDNDGGFGDTGLFGYGASLQWDATGLTKVRAQLERALLDTTLANASGVARTALDIEIEHTLRRNIALGAYFGLDRDRYKGAAGTGDTRDNTTYTAGVGADYLMNENIAAGLRYDYRNRDFENGTGDYSNNIMSFSLNYEY